MLPLYRFKPGTGLWRHRDGIAHFTRATAPESVLPDQLAEARRIIRAATGADWAPPVPAVSADFERIRWFPFPGEVATAADAASALPSRRRP